MGQGYVRNDTANNIDNNNVANASDLDGEFDAIVDAFAAATGHTHDGTTAEGGAITVVGPAQDYVGAAGDFSPKTDSTYDLGKTAVRWATGYMDDLVVTTNITVGGTVDGRDVASDGSKLDGIEASADVTDTANVTAAGALMDSEVTSLSGIKSLTVPDSTTISTYGASLVDDTTAAAARTTLGLGTVATQDASSVTISGGSISGITDLAVADGGTGASTAAGARTNLGLVIGTDVQAYDATILVDADIGSTVQGYDANLPTWPATVDATEVGYLNGVTSAIQTQLDAKADDNSGADTPVATTSGSFFNFFSIDADATEINFHFYNVSLSGASSVLLMRMGTSSGFVTTGYNAAGSRNEQTPITDTTGVPISRSSAADSIHGTATWKRLTPASNIWTCSYSMGGNTTFTGGGSVDLGGDPAWATIVRIGGTDVFDSGQFNVTWK